MSIKPTAATEIRTLVAALSSADEVRRESAVARLAIIGPRAMARLLATYPGADRDTRLAILRVAEAVADPRAIPICLDALSGGGDLASAAASTLRSLLDSPQESAATKALDALVAAAVDPAAERGVRLAAFDALRDMPADIRDRVGDALRRGEEEPTVPAGAAARPPEAVAADAAWQDAIEGKLPEDPVALREAVKTHAAAAALSALQKLVDAVRAREHESSPGARRDSWLQVRGALHQALALRGSRIALYDLRETIAEARRPLPSAFLAAAHAVGDESCLEPIAAAWTAAGGVGGEHGASWRHQLESAFGAIVKQGKVSGRAATVRRIAARYPDAAAALSMPSRTRPRPKPRRRT